MSKNYKENIVYITKIILDSGFDIWQEILDIIAKDSGIGNNVRVALFTIVKAKSGTTSRSPVTFEREVLSLLDDLENKTWEELGFSEDLLPSLDVDFRTRLFGMLIQYLTQRMNDSLDKITYIKENSGMIPTIPELEPEPEEEYGYGYE